MDMSGTHKRILSPLLLLAVLAMALSASHSAFEAPSPKGEKHKGKYFQETGIVAEGKNCGMDSAGGLVVRLDEEHENPLFQSKAPNMVHLLLWFQDGIEAGRRYELPQPRVQACYWEKGDLLMFHTQKAMGWIEFSDAPGSQVLKGRMDMKLVEPDHNMSNSDYHYMGGQVECRLSRRE